MPKLNIPDANFNEDALVAGSVSKALKTAEATKTGDLIMVQRSKIRVIPGFNVRIETPSYLAHVETIAQSMAANGFYRNKPLAGFAGKDGDEDVIFTTDGHTRLKALDRADELGAEISEVPVVLKPPGTSAEDLTVALVEDNEGRPLAPLERAIVAARLISYGMEKAEIAKRLGGVTERYVDDMLLLAAAPPKVRNLVINEKVSFTEAVKVLRKDAGKAAETLTTAVAAAESQGKTRATGKHVNGAAAAKGKPEKAVYRFKGGDIVPASEILKVSKVADGSWWAYVDPDQKAKSPIKITESITITVSYEFGAKPAAPAPAEASTTTVSAEEEITVDDDDHEGSGSETDGTLEAPVEPAAAEAPAAVETPAPAPAKGKGGGKKKAPAAPAADADMGGL
jgi:ParB family chromosome partitioning protein